MTRTPTKKKVVGMITVTSNKALTTPPASTIMTGTTPNG
jgi:hypothetical protein